jgi:hypothetical protein
MKKQKKKTGQLPVQKNMYPKQCRPVKRAAFFHRIGNRHS